MRKEQDTPGSQYGQLIDDHIRAGTIVPVQITCSLLENAMLEHMQISSKGDSTATFLIDGFPRNEDNLTGWQKQIGDKVNIQFVLFFECPENVCVARCLARGKHSGRADDNEEAMKKRFATYLNQTMLIINYYDKLGFVRRIDATRPVKQIYEDVRQLFK